MSDLVTNIGPKYCPAAVSDPLPQPANVEKTPGTGDEPRESKWLPVTAPPLDCREISPAQVLLADPKLSDADRGLLLDYSINREVNPKLSDRFAHHYRSIGQGYNGWQGGTYSTASHVFINALNELLGPDNFEKFQAALFRQDPQKYLVSLDSREAAGYASLDPARLIVRYLRTSGDHLRTEPGLLKAMFYRRSRDIYVLALARGCSLEKEVQENYAETIPGLSEKEYADLRTVDLYAAHSAGRANLLYRQTFQQTLDHFLAAYFRAPSRLKGTYAKAVHLLDYLAPRFGFSAGELDQKISRSLKPQGQINKLADLTKLKRAAVPPEGLPAEVRQILVQTGGWELVRARLAYINFAPRLDKSDTEGLATPLLKRVELSFLRKDGRPIPAWRIASSLVHEAAHIAWRGKAPLLQQLAPNERNAYAEEYQMLKRYETTFGPSAEIDKRLIWLKKVIATANQALGYQANDLTPGKTDLPSKEFCRQHGVSGPEELDLNFYPFVTYE